MPVVLCLRLCAPASGKAYPIRERLPTALRPTSQRRATRSPSRPQRRTPGKAPPAAAGPGTRAGRAQATVLPRQTNEDGSSSPKATCSPSITATSALAARAP